MSQLRRPYGGSMHPVVYLLSLFWLRKEQNQRDRETAHGNHNFKSPVSHPSA